MKNLIMGNWSKQNEEKWKWHLWKTAVFRINVAFHFSCICKKENRDQSQVKAHGKHTNSRFIHRKDKIHKGIFDISAGHKQLQSSQDTNEINWDQDPFHRHFSRLFKSWHFCHRFLKECRKWWKNLAYTRFVKFTIFWVIKVVFSTSCIRFHIKFATYDSEIHFSPFVHQK